MTATPNGVSLQVFPPTLVWKLTSLVFGPGKGVAGWLSSFSFGSFWKCALWLRLQTFVVISQF